MTFSDFSKEVGQNTLEGAKGISGKLANELQSLPRQFSLKEPDAPEWGENAWKKVLEGEKGISGKLADELQSLPRQLSLKEPSGPEETDKPSYPPNSTVEINRKKYRTDDNGQPHMYKDEDGQWKRCPNIEYDINGYHYKTDEKGRIIESSGTLSTKDWEGKKPISAHVPGMQKGDNRGHLIGDRFGGSNRLDNLVPMSEKLNNGEFKKLERQLKNAVDEGKEVYIKIEAEYEGDSERPTGFYVTYSIDGEEHEIYFSNEPQQKEV